MAPRTPVRELTPPRDIQPAARPVNTYVRPAMPERSSLHHVAESLGRAGEPAKALITERQEEADEEAALQGEAAFYRDHQEGYTQAVSTQAIPPHHSPAFLQGLRGAQGAVAGIQMRQDFNARYQAWEGRHSAEPEEFQSFFGDFVSGHLTNDDPDQLRTMLPHVETLTADAWQTFERGRSERVMEGSITTHLGISAITIDEAIDQVFGTGELIPQEMLWADIIAQREAALATGIPPSRYDAGLVDTIIAKAIEHTDEDILALFNETLPGQSIPLGQQPEFLNQRLEAESSVTSARIRRMTEDYEMQVRLDAEREEAIVRGITDYLSDNPTGEIAPDILREWSAIDPRALVKLEGRRSTFTNARTREDPRVLLEVELEVMDGATHADLVAMAGPDGLIRSASTLRRLFDRVDQRTQFGRQMLEAPALDRYRRYLMGSLGARSDPTNLELPRTIPTEEYIEGMRDLEIAAMEWFRDHPNASMEEQYLAMDEIGRFIINRIEGDPRWDDGLTYRSHEDYLREIGDAERQAPSEPDPDAAPRADQRDVTPGIGLPELEAPDDQTRRIIESIPSSRD